jgi:hypothetical protein
MYVVVDVTHIASNTDDWRDRLIKDIVTGTVDAIDAAHRNQRLQIPLPDGLESSRDLIEVFDRLSSWAEANDLPPVGVVLDEYDSWLHDVNLPREAKRMVARLGYSRWNSLVLIATVQRHTAVGEVKEWHMIHAPALVSYQEMARYFAPQLLDSSTPGEIPVVHPAGRYLVDADTLRHMLHECLGARPYFWDSLLRRLKSPRTGNPFILAAEDVQAGLDLLMADEEYLSNLTRDEASDNPLVTDDFTRQEKTILTLFVEKEVATVSYANSQSPEGVKGLVDREIVRVVDSALALNGTIWRDYIRTHWAYFQLFTPQREAAKEERAS